MNKTVDTIVLDYGGVYSHHYLDPWWSELIVALDTDTKTVDGLLHETSSHGGAYRRGEISGHEFWSEVTRNNPSSASFDQLAYLWAASYVPDPEFVDLCANLRSQDMTVGLFMNSDEHRTKYIEETYRLSDSLDFVVSSSHTGFIKPTREAYEGLLERIGVAADRVMYVDDKPVNAEACIPVGIHGVTFTELDQLKVDIKNLTGISV